MSTGCGCVRSPLETAEHRLTGGHEHHCEYLRDRGEGEGKQKEKEDQIVEPVRTLLEEGTGMTRAVQGKHCPEAVHPEEQPDEQELKKPRRKDTPVLSTPPLIPGLRLVKGEKRMIHMEDDEKDGKN
ncbi:unnamed protein product [Coregonus sp. 'balchen']|nr:unnamed protein product [Coregonus sp. 'balchen']